MRSRLLEAFCWTVKVYPSHLGGGWPDYCDRCHVFQEYSDSQPCFVYGCGRECVFEWAAVGSVEPDVISLSHYTNRCEEDPRRDTVRE